MRFATMRAKAVAAALLLAAGVAGRADAADTMLFVSPLRVVIGSGNDTEVLSLTNKGKKQHRYIINLVDQAMDSNGQTSRVDTFPYSAKKMLRFMPREVVLAPGQHQMVRLMVRRPPGLPAGDYHTHVLFDEKFIQSEVSPSSLPPGGFSMNIETQYSVAIPVVVQVGEISSSIALHGASFNTENGGRQFMVDLAREGNAEAQADLAVTVDGKSIVSPSRVRLYREVTDAHIKLPLNVQMKDVAGKTAKVILTAPDGRTQQTRDVVLP